VLAKLSLHLQKRVERQVPGLHITHHQTRLYLTFRQVLNPQAAAGGAEFWKASRNVSTTMRQPVFEIRLGV
jgi:hypothetical protein